MTYVNKSLIPGTVLTDAQTTQYTATNVTAIIDKFTAANFGVSAAVISVNLVKPATAASNENIVIVTKTLQAGETYLCPELVGHNLPPGGFVSTLASIPNSITINMSGREVS